VQVFRGMVSGSIIPYRVLSLSMVKSWWCFEMVIGENWERCHLEKTGRDVIWRRLGES
jgi:hypothetical protein